MVIIIGWQNIKSECQRRKCFLLLICVWRLSLIWSDLIHNRWWPTDQQLRHEWQRFRPFTITMPFWFFLSLLPKRPTHTFNRVLSRKLLSYSSKRKTCFFFQSIDQNLKFKIEKYKKKRFTFKQTNKLTVWVYNKDILHHNSKKLNKIRINRTPITRIEIFALFFP